MSHAKILRHAQPAGQCSEPLLFKLVHTFSFPDCICLQAGPEMDCRDCPEMGGSFACLHIAQKYYVTDPQAQHARRLPVCIALL